MALTWKELDHGVPLVLGGLGHAGRVTRDANLDLLRALAGMDAHLSVDIETGYADDPAAIAQHDAELAAAAGVNIEHSTGEALVVPTAAAAITTAVERLRRACS